MVFDPQEKSLSIQLVMAQQFVDLKDCKEDLKLVLQCDRHDNQFLIGESCKQLTYMVR
jgi:hypothetical protein